MIKITIYTDGSYRSSKDRMGLGLLWLKNEKEVFSYSKGIKGGTNNIAELLAIYVALCSIKKNIDSLEIVSDSEYSIGVLTKQWNPKKNIKLINKIKKQIIETQKLISEPIKWTHVKGHSDCIENCKCDKLATKASEMLL